jgi:alginate O-acetyltransferase complex protein AlgJ
VRRLVTKSILFLLPFLCALALETFVFPVDRFTFRSWEALKAGGIREMFQGYFYPQQSLTKLEEGDLGHHTPYAVKKLNRWVTDASGYRKEPVPGARPIIVIVGDSNVAGAGVSQHETLAAVLGAALNVDVYPVAPANMNNYLKDVRFLINPPKVVIVASIEKAIPTLHGPRRELLRPTDHWRSLQAILLSVRTHPALCAITVPFDRMLKSNMLHYVRASVRRLLGRNLNRNVVVGNDGATLFLRGALTSRTMGEEQVTQSVAIIESYARAVKARGSTLLFLPIPNKENIHGDLLGITEPRDFIPRLTEVLSDRAIPTINTQRLFEEAVSRGSGPLYLRDDSHWNARGIRIAAEAVAALIGKEGLVKDPGAPTAVPPDNGEQNSRGRRL